MQNKNFEEANLATKQGRKLKDGCVFQEMKKASAIKNEKET